MGGDDPINKEEDRRGGDAPNVCIFLLSCSSCIALRLIGDCEGGELPIRAAEDEGEGEELTQAARLVDAGDEALGFD